MEARHFNTETGKNQIAEMHDSDVEDLLGREPVPGDSQLLGANIHDKTVMVTGAGGSIGSELCRQILFQRPRKLILLEVSEFALYQIDTHLHSLAKAHDIKVSIFAIQGSIQNAERLKAIMGSFQVQTVYHAAAYKHVPMVERNMIEGLRNNVFGTLACAEAAIATKAEAFIFISTDKAVRPTNVMGASKRLAELVCQALSDRQSTTLFSMVRFGNVLSSSGSVIPLFREQIAVGGPITVTHPEIVRYFMTISEAVQLVIQAGAMARGGDVFVLNMGEPVKIAELASQMARLSGLTPNYPQDSDRQKNANQQSSGSIDIIFTGLRPGEKLYEELLIGDSVYNANHPHIMTAREASISWDELSVVLDQLNRGCELSDCKALRKSLLDAPIDYQPSGEIVDWLADHHP